jgi:selenocysteine-specific elongation factor
VRGDRYILRRPSPGETLGGGAVVDPQPKHRHKRFDEAVLRSLESMAKGSPADILLQVSLALGPVPLKDVVQRARLEVHNAAAALEELAASGQLVPLEDGELSPTADILVMAQGAWSTLRDSVVATLVAFHKNFPLRRGMAREELKSRLKLTPRVFTAVVKKLAAEGALTESGSWVARTGHEIEFTPEQQAAIKHLTAKFIVTPYSPPTVKECQAEVGEEVFNALVELGDLVTVSAEVVFRKSDYNGMVAKIRQEIQEKGQITVADVRDLFDTSRRYALALMEYLDSIGVTVRDGDSRRLKK